MSKTLLLVLLLAVPGFGQQPPSWEFFGGYSLQQTSVREYYKSTPIIYSTRNLYENLNGWDFSITENMNRWFGGTLDVSGHYKTPNLSGSNNREQMHSVLYGPRFSLRRSSYVPFVHALLGAAIMNVAVQPTGPHASNHSFAFAAGGGFDWSFHKRAAIRLLQADYFHANALGGTQNHYRASAGLIFYVGKKK